MLSEREVAFVKAQSRKAGNFMITIPNEVARLFTITAKTKVKVLVDENRRRIIYQL